MSFPTRERGLKFKANGEKLDGPLSFPTRERGLKYHYGIISLSLAEVVPHEGTWIEILTTLSSKLITYCRSPRGNVD